MQGDSLSIKFSRLYSLSNWKFFSVNQFISLWKNGSNERWTRTLRAWESELEDDLNSLVHSTSLSFRKDSVKWNLNGSSFSTKECYQLIEGFDNHNERNWMKVWKLKVPPKIHMFLWKLEQGVIASKVFLKSRLHQMNDSICSNYKIHEEDSEHIFWKCSAATDFDLRLHIGGV